MNHFGSVERIAIHRVILAGSASASALVLDEPISFWGGIDPTSGNIIDVHHPQYGLNISKKLLFLPGTRGSTAAPGALLEALCAGYGPAAIILTRKDVAALIAVTTAAYLGVPSIPIVEVNGVLPSALRNPDLRWKVSCVGLCVTLQRPLLLECG